MQCICRHIYSLNCSHKQLSDSGLSLFPGHINFSTIFFSRGFPPSNFGFLAPPGLTLTSDRNYTPSIFNWENHQYLNYSFFSNSSLYQKFSPSTVLSPSLLKSLFKSEIKIPSFKLTSYTISNITYINSNILLTITSFDDLSNLTNYSTVCSDLSISTPKLYRTLTGNLTGISHTTITIPKSYSPRRIQIYEPILSFCRPYLSLFSSTCSIIDYFSNSRGVFINTISSNCTISYQYKCDFLHWSKFPQNPDRGFFAGPDIIFLNQSNQTLTLFSNNVNFRIPTPDFSMVYNTPLMTGFIFSLFFSLTIRWISQKIHSK